MRIFSLAVLVVSLLTAPAAQAADTQASELDSVDRREELIGWEAVGRIDMRGNGTCTGALIEPDLVLTAAHCVVNDDGEKLSPSSITFRAGLRNGEYLAGSKGLAIAVASGFKQQPDGTILSKHIARDVALIKLASPIPRALAQPFQINRTRVSRGELMVASYGRGRNSTISVQRSCNVLDKFSNGVMAFDCDITFGSSGSPVLAYDGMRLAVVSVVSAVRQEGNKKVGLGMDIIDIVPVLKREIALGAPQQALKPVVARRITVGGSGRTQSVGSSKFVSAK